MQSFQNKNIDRYDNYDKFLFQHFPYCIYILSYLCILAVLKQSDDTGVSGKSIAINPIISVNPANAPLNPTRRPFHLPVPATIPSTLSLNMPAFIPESIPMNDSCQTSPGGTPLTASSAHQNSMSFYSSLDFMSLPRQYEHRMSTGESGNIETQVSVCTYGIIGLN